MSLKDLDRPAVTFRYEPWDQELTFRRIDAKAFVSIAGAYTDVTGADAESPDVIEFYASLLAASCESPQFTAEQWLEASGPTLIELGIKALRVNGLAREEAKKNLTAHSTDLPSSSAAS
jgi:hypothetical protein